MGFVKQERNTFKILRVWKSNRVFIEFSKIKLYKNGEMNPQKILYSQLKLFKVLLTHPLAQHGEGVIFHLLKRLAF